MNSKELLIKAEQRIAEAENIKMLVESASTLEQLIIEVQRPANDICIGELSEETNISGAIGQELNLRLKTVISDNLGCFLFEKNKELEDILGICKPTIINPEFQTSVQKLINGSKAESKLDSDPVEDRLSTILKKESKRFEDEPIIPESSLDKYPAKKGKIQLPKDMTEEAVTIMYITEGKTIKQVAERFDIKQSRVNDFLSKHNIRRTSYKSHGTVKQPEETERP